MQNRMTTEKELETKIESLLIARATSVHSPTVREINESLRYYGATYLAITKKPYIPVKYRDEEPHEICGFGD